MTHTKVAASPARCAECGAESTEPPGTLVWCEVARFATFLVASQPKTAAIAAAATAEGQTQ